MRSMTPDERKILLSLFSQNTKIVLPTIEYIVITYEKNHDICKSIKNTWGKNKKVLFLSDTNLDSDIRNFGGQKGYKYIYTKYVGLFKNYQPQSDWICFCDDDSYIIEKNLLEILGKLNKNLNICIGKIGELTAIGLDSSGKRTGFPYKSLSGKDTRLPLLYPSGGAGFVITNKTFQIIKDIIEDNPETAYNSDVAMGFWLRRAGTNLLHNYNFNHTNPETLNHNNQQMKESISYHYVKNHYDLHRRLYCD